MEWPRGRIEFGSHNTSTLEAPLPTDNSPQEKLVEQYLAERTIEVFSAVPEPENAAYGAQLLHTSMGMIRVRQGKTTPTKPGVFIAHWRRLQSGETGPFAHDDGSDFLLVTAQENTPGGTLTGIFLIPTAALATHRIVSIAGLGGKRGFRLYPSWLTALNPQATRSQAWQGEFFHVITD